MSKLDKPIGAGEMMLHDSIVSQIVTNLTLNEGATVRYNKIGEYNHGVGVENMTFYPDIFVLNDSGFAYKIYMIETTETIRNMDDSLLEEWRILSNAAADFFIVVPQKMLVLVKSLIEDFNKKLQPFQIKIKYTDILIYD